MYHKTKKPLNNYMLFKQQILNCNDYFPEETKSTQNNVRKNVTFTETKNPKDYLLFSLRSQCTFSYAE